MRTLRRGVFVNEIMVIVCAFTCAVINGHTFEHHHYVLHGSMSAFFAHKNGVSVVFERLFSTRIYEPVRLGGLSVSRRFYSYKSEYRTERDRKRMGFSLLSSKRWVRTRACTVRKGGSTKSVSYTRTKCGLCVKDPVIIEFFVLFRVPNIKFSDSRSGRCVKII